ncbi:hypothetical protein TGAMA5MH_07808 [Trichoderma gamsii]|uniref:Uncharacterized protein n=1 Tax=Trichoderma gamsii TaxID=398673 RepID=A0A2K0T432_9HYPO|nr:hypothetical protein TGAMA5MH_07808 [Trichoderma gamsii]
MSYSSGPIPENADEYADWNMYMPLIADDADNAGFRIKNAPGGESHRVLITGYDRPKATAVRGRLFHVVHGIMGNGNSNPATLIVFEWLLIPGRLRRRFRDVSIDVTFSPCGRRPGKKLDADLSSYTPKVMSIAPSVPLKSYFSSRDVTRETQNKVAINLGYQPYASFSPEISKKSTEVTFRTDYRFVAGYASLVKKTWGEPNSVHWTLQENAPQESGVPYVLRTAVVIQRVVGDYGLFSAAVNITVNVSVIENATETLKKLVGLVPDDDPVTFDPKLVDVKHGPAVLYGSRDVVNRQSPCDVNNLGAEDLTKFLIEDDDAKWRVDTGSTGNSRGEPGEKNSVLGSAESEE